MIHGLKCVLFVLILLPLLKAADNKTVIHPQISFHNSATTENPVAFNGDKIYLATKFYGHIYEYYYMADSTYFIDKFKLREKDSNKNTAGAMVYHDDYLYTGTTYSFIRIPEIYIFNTNIPGEQILPEFTLNLMQHDPTLLVFYNPIVIGDFIYWGTYHSKSGPARLVRLRVTDRNFTDEDIYIVNSLYDDAPKTYSLTRINDILYVSTNTGKILRFKLDLNDGSVVGELTPLSLGIEEASREVQHLKADPVNNILWANTTLRNSLFCISKPDGDYEVKQTWHNIVNTRIYLGPDGFLYGQGRDRNKRKIVGYKIKRTENGFNYRIVGGLFYSRFGVILGGGYNRQGRPYIIGEDFRKADENPDLKHMRVFNLNTDERTDQETAAIKINTVGMTLNTFASDNNDTFYLSTYQTGYLYKINAEFEGKDYLPPGRLRYTYQADVIREYPQIPGSMLFGIYGGTGRASRLIFFDTSTSDDPWKHWILPKGPDGILYERLKAMAVNPINNDVYIGTSNHLLDSKAYPAKIFRLSKNKLFNIQGKSEDWEELKFIWPQTGDRRDHPGDFMAMESDGIYLYCITQHYDKKKKIRENRFFRVRTDISEPRILESDIKTEEKYNSSSTHCDKVICVDGRTLLVGYGPRLFRYDLDHFAINNPNSVYTLGKEQIVSILSDATKYYLCQPHTIRIFDKYMNEKRQIFPPDEQVENDYFETISLNQNDGYLYAITHNGILYKFRIDLE